MDGQYIILNGKTPTHKFKNGEGAKTWEEVKDYDDVAVIVPEGYIVLDFDTTSDAAIMLNIVNGLNLKTRVLKTTRGIHCWFKTAEDAPKNFIKNRLAVGIYSDRKAGGRNAYVKIKDGGKMRDWIVKNPIKDLEVVPKWLSSVSAPSDKFKFKHMEDGSGRNQELYNYIVYLQAKEFTRDEIRDTIRIINDYVLADPLEENEIDTILRDEAFKSDEEIAEQIENAKKVDGFKHNEFGDQIIETYNVITVNNQMYVYDDGYYQADEKVIERKMISLFPSIKTSQRTEVLNYMRIQTYINQTELNVNPYIINLTNTRLNILTDECLPFTPEAIEFDRIPVTYDPTAYCADVDKMLNRVFLGDTDIINLFEEMIGACLMKRTTFGKAFIFYGSGANGKSTILDMIKKFLGSRNYAAIPLEKLSEKFIITELENKLANIGDDIDNTTIRNAANLKRLFDGNSTIVERKGEKPFELKPYATHIFSANAIPHSSDKSDGFYRRWCFIPFVAKFTANDPDYDPLIGDKITTDEALSYLLNIGLRGAKRLIKRGGFTEPDTVVNLLNAYKIENSTVLSWIEDFGKDNDYFLNTEAKELYSIFGDWCRTSGILNVTKKPTFYKEVARYFGFEEKIRQKSDHKRYFVIKI